MNQSSLMGFEPTIFPLGEGRVIQLRHRDNMSCIIKKIAATRDRTGDLQIFSLTLSQLSYSGLVDIILFGQKKKIISKAGNEIRTHDPLLTRQVQ